jgi:hypothetical protein
MIFGRELRDVEGRAVELEWWSGVVSFQAVGSFVPFVPSQPPHAVPPPTNETYDVERGAHVFSLASLFKSIFSLSLSPLAQHAA